MVIDSRDQRIQVGRLRLIFSQDYPAINKDVKNAEGRLCSGHQVGLQEKGQNLPHFRVLLAQPAQSHRKVRTWTRAQTHQRSHLQNHQVHTVLTLQKHHTSGCQA